jgi:hypothetical protein
MRRAALGISAHLGWASSAAVVVRKAGVQVVRTDRLEIVAPGDRAAREPYHVAGGFDGLERVPRPRDPEAGLQRGLSRQRRLAMQAIRRLFAALEAEGHRVAFAGLLVSRGRRAPSFERAVASHTQIHIEEGVAIRESIRAALEACGARVRELDQKSLWADGASRLQVPESALAATLAQARPGQGAWRKEEQSAALAAWLSWPSSRARGDPGGGRE